ncbi:MAG: hypothetical protein AAGF25_04415 [Pseudomonadota bacterium]
MNAEFIASKLIEMPVEQLNCVFDALKAAEDSLLGVLNQPRCVAVAEELIDDLMSELACSREVLVKEAMARELNEQTRDYILQMRLKYEAQYADDPVSIASIVLRFAD